MVGMYSAYRNVLYNELGWKPSFCCFKNVLFWFLFCFLYYNFGVVFVAVFLCLNSIPLFKYEYLMSVYLVCKGRNCEAILYSLQKLLRFGLQSLFLGKSIYNPQCQNV